MTSLAETNNSQRESNPGSPLPPDNAQLLSMMRVLMEESEARMAARLETKIEERLALPTNSQADYELRKKAAERRWEEESRQARRNAYLREGLSEQEADQALRDNPLANVTNPTTIVNQPSRRYNITSTDVGLFDGDTSELNFWLERVSTLYDMKEDPAWRQQLMETIPLCLRGSAKKWYQAIAQTDQRRELLEWTSFSEHIRLAFEPAASSLRRQADERKFRYKEEEAGDYFYEKLSLLRAAYRHRTDAELVHDIWLGLPDTLQTVCRAPATDRTLKSLLTELRLYESSWRNGDSRDRSLRTTASGKRAQIQASADETTPTVSSKASTPSAAPNTRQRVDLSATYKPENIKMIKGERWYLVPGTTRMMKLERTCNTCKQAHFDFEHHHLAKPVKAEANMAFEQHLVPTAFHFEGYPVYELAGSPFAPIVVDGDSDSSGSSAHGLSPSWSMSSGTPELVSSRFQEITDF